MDNKTNKPYLHNPADADHRFRFMSIGISRNQRSTSPEYTLTESVQGERYYSDLFETYQTLVYWPAEHFPMQDKSETYSVEADNALLRHYLARLARRSRCFSRCAKALRRAVQLFVFAWNRRQLFKREHPRYASDLIDFVNP